MKNVILSVSLVLAGFFVTPVQAQPSAKNTEPPVVSFKGKITFERKANSHKQLDDMMKGQPGSENMLDQVKKQIPKYKVDFFELFFNQDISLYKLAKDGLTESKMMMGNQPADRNTVYRDLTKNQNIAEKFIYDKTYLIQDSIPQYQWKITEEFRKIAGYNCRRAETIIMDSIYVIAFYTDAIVTASGPESFSGLPGMILGIVMPRLNVTYFATKVDQYIPDEKGLLAPTKGEKNKNAQLDAKLRESMKQWGPWVNRILWYVNI